VNGKKRCKIEAEWKSGQKPRDSSVRFRRDLVREITFSLLNYGETETDRNEKRPWEIVTIVISKLQLQIFLLISEYSSKEKSIIIAVYVTNKKHNIAA
jgi:hypothetical protein